MTVRTIDLSTGEELEPRALTQAEIDASAANTAAEQAAKAAEVDDDADFQSDLKTTDAVIAAVTDPEARAALQALSNVMQGNGPKGAKVKGRK